MSAVTRFRTRVFDAPVSCANHLSVTTQVPVRQVYLTSGASRELRLGKQVTPFSVEACARRARLIGITAPRPPSHVVKKAETVAALRLRPAPIRLMSGLCRPTRPLS
ncbi:DUF6088 family protein [Bradyrhizobium sp. CCGUVB1N3]|nr:DUF6088 family protein [Bradyrhizobium sp. CCGUVB1N3]